MAEPALESAARVAEQILAARYPDQAFVVTVGEGRKSDHAKPVLRETETDAD